MTPKGKKQTKYEDLKVISTYGEDTPENRESVENGLSILARWIVRKHMKDLIKKRQLDLLKTDDTIENSTTPTNIKSIPIKSSDSLTNESYESD
jgi:hypothetical protein